MAMDKYRTQVPLKPGALEFLRYCKDQGIATGIATSNGRPIVDAVIEALQIGEYFQEVATACEVETGKAGAGYLSGGGETPPGGSGGLSGL